MVDTPRISLGESAAAKARRIQSTQSRVDTATVASSAVVERKAPESTAPVTGFTAREPTGVVPKSTALQQTQDYEAPLEATKLESFGAAMGGLAIDWIREGKSMYLYDRDPEFDPSALNDEFFTKHGAGTKLEVSYLADSRTFEDWQQKTEYVQDQRMRAQAMADNPWSSTAGSLLDIDLALSAVPIVGWGSKAARVGEGSRKLARVKAGAVAAGATVAIQDAQGDSTLRTPQQQMIDASIMGMARMFAPLAKAPVAPTAVIQATEEVVSTAGTTAPKATQKPIVASTDAARAKALEEAQVVGRTDAEIAAEPKHIRGDLRKARAAERKAAVEKVNKEFDELDAAAYAAANPTRADKLKAINATEDAEVATIERTYSDSVAELKASNPPLEQSVYDARVAELAVERQTGLDQAKAKRVAAREELDIKLVAPTDTQRIAQQAMDELAVIQSVHPTGSPAQQVAKNKWIAKFQSTADELNWLTQGDTNTVVNKLYSNPAINNGDDVVSAQNVYLNNYEARLMGIEDSLKSAVAATGIRDNPYTRWTGKYREATQQVSADFQVAMQKLDAEALAYYSANGKVPDRALYAQMIEATGHHPSMKKLMNDYIDSGFATKIYDDVYDRGWLTREVTDPVTGVKSTVNGMDDVVRRPSYMNLKHSYDKIEHSVNVRKIATMDEMADFIGHQIAKMYPDLLNPKNATKTFVLSERQIGQHFIQTQANSARSLSDVSSTGMNKTQIADILTQVGGMTNKEAGVVAKRMFDEMHAKGTNTPKNLRRRIEWDWSAKMRTSSGHELTMRDIVDDSVMGNLEDYARSSAHRNGMADYGLNSVSELENLLESYLSKLPEGTNVQQARQFMQNTRDVILGRAIENNPVPEGIRSAQAIADLFLLANSGLYTMIDIATQMQKVGVIRSLPAMKQGMKATFNNLSKFSATEAKELEDILTGRLLAGSRFKNFTVRYADNFEVSAGIHEAAQHYGQTARFLNLSESLKRFQVGILSSVYVNNLKGAMTGSAKELKFMKDKLKMSDTLIKEIQGEYAKHGTKIDNWKNSTRIKYEQKVFHDADNLAMNVHRGEVPAILEHSQVGRIIFPYMRYAFGMQNKVLRRTINRDGAAGIAMLLAVQIPTAMLVGASINIRKGEEYDKDLLALTLRSMSALGSLNYPMEIALSGVSSSGVTAAAPFSKTYNLGKEVISGGGDGEFSWRQAKVNSPLNAAVPLDLLLLALEE